MRGKAHEYFKCDPTDKLILFNYLTNMNERIEDELELLNSKKKFLANTEQTFAGYFIDEAEKLFKKKGYYQSPSTQLQIKNLREKLNNYSFWRAFTQTLQFSALVFSSGSIPNMVQYGVRNIRGGSVGGRKSGEARNEKSQNLKTKWQLDADKIWKKLPNLSKKSIAETIAKKTGENPDTIRKSIKKPLL